MNKKKIKELALDTLTSIKEVISSTNDTLLSLTLANIASKIALIGVELDKSDWISVRDELLPYDQNVEVRNIAYPNLVWTASRHQTVKDNYGFVIPLWRKGITHWKPIEKLEE